MDTNVDTKQYTWQNFIEAVTEDQLEDRGIEQVEVGCGPSPVEITSPLLDALSQFPQQHCKREHQGEWPDSLAMQDTVMVDLATDEDMTVITEWARGQIVYTFGISKEQLEEVRTAFQSLECEVNWRHVASCVAFCTPSRNAISGG